MGLETPLALLGLLSVLLPILAHRMRNRELPRVLLPTFALLSRAAARSQHKRALSDVLLLILRAAIVTMACFALATPYLSSRVSFGDGRPSNLAIVLDDSLSMARSDGARSLVEQARARALDVLGALSEGSEVSVVLSGKPARVLVPLSRDLGSVQRALEAAQLRAVRASDLNGAVELALRQQSRGGAESRRVLVLSDFARHNGVLSVPDAVPLTAERIGSLPNRPNLFIAEAHAASDPTRPRDLSIAVEARAARVPGMSDPGPARIEIEIGGKVSASARLDFERDAARSVLHVPAPASSESVEATLRLVADDALAADNELALVLGRADAVRVLLVNGDPRPASRSDELYYVSRALSLVPDSLLSLQLQNIDPLSFERATLSDFDVVLLANAPPPSQALGTRLLQFVRQGGGLIVAAGSRVDAAPYNALLGPVLASHIRGLAPAQKLRFAEGQVNGFLPEGLAGLREVQNTQRLLLEPGPADVLLAFEDGTPALTARNEGDGRSLLFATALDDDFGDLPFRPGFLPLLAAMIREAAGSAAATRSRVSAGDSVLLPVPRNAAYVEVRAPDGRTQRWENQRGEPLRLNDTDQLGVYRVRVGQREGTANLTRDAFVVEAPRDESDLTPGPLPAPPPNQAPQPTASSVHKPFTPTLLLLLFGLVVGEGLLRTRRRLAT
jgi:antitoxin (DNA-binding transcriptional repressor) of toxin-antitoxin stability system